MLTLLADTLSEEELAGVAEALDGVDGEAVGEAVLAGAGILTILGAMIGVIAVIGVVWYILQVIAYWKMFNKFGEPGWKSIIPIYNDFILFKYTWNVKMFLVTYGLMILSCILTVINGNLEEPSTIINILGIVIAIASLVIGIMGLNKVSKAFGYGVGFTIGLLLLNPIFKLILGFGGAQYIGNTTEQ